MQARHASDLRNASAAGNAAPTPLAMFLNYINNFRGIAILLVLSVHCLLPFERTMDPLLWQSSFVLLQDGTVLFVFISGFLFQHLLGKFIYKEYLITKVKFILAPYILISIPGILWNMNRTGDFGLVHVIRLLETGYHIDGTMGIFWFIPMILLFFIAAPAFALIDRRPRSYLVVPLLLLISTVVARSENPAVNFLHFLPVYLIGMLFSHYKAETEFLLRRYIHAIVLTYLSLVILDVLDVHSHFAHNPLGTNSFLRLWSKLLLCFILLHVLKTYDHSMKNRLDLVTRYSFGIFFIQGYVISVFIRLIPHGLIASGRLLNPVVFLTAILASCLIILRSIKVIFKDRSRFLVGV